MKYSNKITSLNRDPNTEIILWVSKYKTSCNALYDIFHGKIPFNDA